MIGNITLPSKLKTGKEISINYVEDDVYELPDSDLAEASAIIFDKIYNGNDGVLE